MAKRLARGALVVFEGIDGAGKTTQAHRLVKALGELGWEAIYTKEPTDGPWGQKIRASVTGERLSLEDELEAFLEDRKEHVRDLLEPALRAGTVVVLDRYYFSTAAYQGPRGADPRQILQTNERFAPRPDLLVFLDIPVEVAMERIERRGLGSNSFEKADALEKSAAIFRAIDGSFLLALDGRRPIDELAAEILGALRHRLLRDDSGPAVLA
jgi:dTMP kinase